MVPRNAPLCVSWASEPSDLDRPKSPSSNAYQSPRGLPHCGLLKMRLTRWEL